MANNYSLSPDGTNFINLWLSESDSESYRSLAERICE